MKKVACVKDFWGRAKHCLYHIICENGFVCKDGLCKTFSVQVLCVKLCTCKLVHVETLFFVGCRQNVCMSKRYTQCRKHALPAFYLPLHDLSTLTILCVFRIFGV